PSEKVSSTTFWMVMESSASRIRFGISLCSAIVWETVAEGRTYRSELPHIRPSWRAAPFSREHHRLVQGGAARRRGRLRDGPPPPGLQHGRSLSRSRGQRHGGGDAAQRRRPHG